MESRYSKKRQYIRKRLYKIKTIQRGKLYREEKQKKKDYIWKKVYKKEIIEKKTI